MSDTVTGWHGYTPDLKAGARRIGYARVSTADQKLDMQIDALNRAECDLLFTDHGVSGAKAKRDGLDQALAELRTGDALVVFKLDRLGRSVLHLADLLTRLDNRDIHFCSLSEGINTATSGGRLVFHVFAAVAEFHRDLIRENTVNGLQAAKARGSKLGRPRIMSDGLAIKAHRLVRQDGMTLDQAADHFRVSRSTLRRGIMRIGLNDDDLAA